MTPPCLDQGVGLTPWGPLARGFLAGHHLREAEGPTTRSKSDSLAHDMY